MRIEWGPALETGVRVMDRQHEELVGMLNELDALRQAGAAASLDSILQRLDAYIVFHFGTEEALMAGLSQPAFAVNQHCREHREFIVQFGRMRQRADRDSQQAVGELADYLGQWLLQHILKTDRALAVALTGQLADTGYRAPRP